MRRATILILALLLVPAARADAKYGSARVCGPSSCREVDLAAEHTLLPIVQAAFPRDHRPASKPPEASPWYRVTLGPGDSRHTFTLKVLPAIGYEYLPPKEQGPRKGWATLGQRATDVYRRVTKDLEPFPASRLIALGAVEPSSELGGDSEGGIPAWAWIAIAAAITAFALLSARTLQRSRRARTAP